MSYRVEMLGVDGEAYDQTHEHACCDGTHGDGLHLRDGDRDTWIFEHAIQTVTITTLNRAIEPERRRVERRDRQGV